MRRLTNSVLLLLTAATLSFQAMADQVYEYRLENLGSVRQLAECNAKIAQIAQTFASQSGITPFASGCSEDDIDRGYLDGVISYVAEARVKILSTDDRGLGVDPPGGFNSMESCLEAMPRRITQFETVFGTEPMTAYCYRWHRYSPHFVLRIEAVGESEVKAFTAGFEFFGRPVGEPRKILTDLKAAAELRFPGRVMDTSFDSSPGYVRTTLRYYSDVRVRLHNLDEMKFATVEACVESLGTISEIFTSFTDKPASLFCTTDGLAGIRGNIATFTMEIGAADGYLWYQAPTTYANRDDCRQGSLSVSLDRLAGLVCTDTVPSVMHLFIRPAEG